MTDAIERMTELFEEMAKRAREREAENQQLRAEMLRMHDCDHSDCIDRQEAAEAREARLREALAHIRDYGPLTDLGGGDALVMEGIAADALASPEAEP
jgi:hypothetical protein